jgi:hypothetical protein
MADPLKLKKPKRTVTRKLKKPTRLKPPSTAKTKVVPSIEELERDLPERPKDVADVALDKLIADIKNDKVDHRLMYEIIKDKYDACMNILEVKRKARASQSKYPGQPRSKHANPFAGMSSKEVVEWRKAQFSADDAVIPEDDPDDYVGKEFDEAEAEEEKRSSNDD